MVSAYILRTCKINMRKQYDYTFMGEKICCTAFQLVYGPTFYQMRLARNAIESGRNAPFLRKKSLKSRIKETTKLMLGITQLWIEENTILINGKVS